MKEEGLHASRRLTIKMNPDDNVAMSLIHLTKGTEVEVHSSEGSACQRVRLAEDIPLGHKFALRPLSRSDQIIKYGMSVGTTLADIPEGGWVGEHNME